MKGSKVLYFGRAAPRRPMKCVMSPRDVLARLKVGCFGLSHLGAGLGSRIPVPETVLTNWQEAWANMHEPCI